MIYTYWRYLILWFLKLFSICLISFIVIILTTRLTQIAEFIALGAHVKHVLLFVLYQIPYILPFALPLSCLIAAVLLMQHLSQTSQMTAFRASGISTLRLLSPLLILSCLLSFGNFLICSEVATQSHLASRKLLYRVTHSNPMIVLQHQKLLQGAKSFIQMEPVAGNKAAEDIIIAYKTEDGTYLFLADRLEKKGKLIFGDQISLISPSKDNFDLFIENQSTMAIEASELTSFIKKKGWKVSNDHLNLAMLQIKKNELLKKIKNTPSLDLKKLCYIDLKRCRFELCRRISFALAPLMFTFLGLTHGMQISRIVSKKTFIQLSILSALTICCLFSAQAFDRKNHALILLFFPYFILIAFSYLRIRSVNKGEV